MLRSSLVLLAVTAWAGLGAIPKPMTSSDIISSDIIPTISVTSVELATVPAADQRAAGAPHTLDTLRTFPKLTGLADWQAHRQRLRQQALVACGLSPLPTKTPLRAKVFGRVARDGYSIEKVYFQTYPGFYLAGNLYRPLQNDEAEKSAEAKKSAGAAGTQVKTKSSAAKTVPCPGILVTHGHWEDGRMADGPDGSIAARAITFARQGCVVFTYDMVGLNDTRQIPTHRTFAADNAHWLWGISLMGLQTWNSVRALDFLESLPDVDKARLAITGESGGGTQTMMLEAVDDRLAAVAPESCHHARRRPFAHADANSGQRGFRHAYGKAFR